MDRISNSFVISYKILVCVIISISLLLKFAPFFVTVIIVGVLFSVLLYFDSSCASDICALFASWLYLFYIQASNCFGGVSSSSKRPVYVSSVVNPKLSPKINQLSYIKMKNDLPNSIPREPNLNSSVRSVRSRNNISSLASQDYCVNLREEKSNGTAFGSPRSNRTPKNSVLSDVTSNYTLHQRYTSPLKNDRRDFFSPHFGGSPISNNCDQLYGNISSPGFSSRVAQCVSEFNSSNRSKYPNVGDFPLVHFNQEESKKKITPNKSQSAGKKRVTVRIAPPVNRSLRKVYSIEHEEKMKSVLEVLKEMSRKRMYSAVDTEESESCKRLRTASLTDIPLSRRAPISQHSIIPQDITPLGKRIRDSSSDSLDEEVIKKRRQISTVNNEIKSSLSSSLTITPPHLSKSNSTKRKAVADDSSVDKHFKASSLSDSSSDLSEENSQNSSQLSSDEKSCQASSSFASNSSKNLSKVNDVEVIEEVSLNQSNHPNSTKQSSIVSNDSVDSNTSVLRNDETGVLRLKPVKTKAVIVETKKDEPKKDVLRLPKDWEQNPRSLQTSTKNPGRMLKKILCAIEGTDNVNLDSMPAHVRKLLSTMDDVDTVDGASKTAKTPENQTKEATNSLGNKPTFTFGDSASKKDNTSVASSTFTAPTISTSFKFPDSTTKTSAGPFSFTASASANKS